MLRELACSWTAALVTLLSVDTIIMVLQIRLVYVMLSVRLYVMLSVDTIILERYVEVGVKLE
jgi:hypothetical protein